MPGPPVGARFVWKNGQPRLPPNADIYSAGHALSAGVEKNPNALYAANHWSSSIYCRCTISEVWEAFQHVKPILNSASCVFILVIFEQNHHIVVRGPHVLLLNGSRRHLYRPQELCKLVRYVFVDSGCGVQLVHPDRPACYLDILAWIAFSTGVIEDLVENLV